MMQFDPLDRSDGRHFFSTRLKQEAQPLLYCASAVADGPSDALM